MAKKDLILKRIKKGFFITFEGSEGSGKSTQSKFLCDYLRSLGAESVYLREPGGTKISEKIRAILLNPENGSMVPVTEMLLYMAARAQTVSEIIKPGLSQRRIIICDRFLDSTVVYQGYGLGMDVKVIKDIGNLVTQGMKPDLTIFLDLPVKKGLRYRQDKRDRIEKRPLSYHMRVRKGYLALAKSEPERFKVIKVDDNISVTQERIRESVCPLLISRATTGR